MSERDGAQKKCARLPVCMLCAYARCEVQIEREHRATLRAQRPHLVLYRPSRNRHGSAEVTRLKRAPLSLIRRVVVGVFEGTLESAPRMFSRMF